MQDLSKLDEIAGALTVESKDSFVFAGKPFSCDATTAWKYIAVPGADPLLTVMTGVLYDQCYCRHFNGGYFERQPVEGDNRVFQQSLTGANRSTEKWEKDWVVEQVLSTGQYVVSKQGNYKFVYPGEFLVSEYYPALPKEGTRVSIHQPKESSNIQPAFYYVFGSEAADRQGLLTLVRFYWNLKEEGAAELIGLLTEGLNRFDIPFTLKCLNHPGLFTRMDAAILYIGKPQFNITAQIVAALYPQIETKLNKDVLLFSKALRPGLSLAEDPGTGESFGMNRCALVAQGLYDAFLSGVSEPAEKKAFVHKAFAARSIDLKSPYLNAGSTDIYDLPVN